MHRTPAGILIAAGLLLAQDEPLILRPAAPPKAPRAMPLAILDDGVLYAESPLREQSVDERQRNCRLLVDAVKIALRELSDEGFFRQEKECAPKTPPRR
jgi:hypothetical protein